MSRLLRETVAAYGYNNASKYDDDSQQPLGGPFFCGMSRVMTLPQFAIRLFSPTSTSCKIAVAVNFSGHQGIIVEFMTGQEYNAASLRGLDLSWISRFKEEDERCEKILCSSIHIHTLLLMLHNILYIGYFLVIEQNI